MPSPGRGRRVNNEGSLLLVGWLLVGTRGKMGTGGVGGRLEPCVVCISARATPLMHCCLTSEDRGC